MYVKDNHIVCELRTVIIINALPNVFWQVCSLLLWMGDTSSVQSWQVTRMWRLRQSCLNPIMVLPVEIRQAISLRVLRNPLPRHGTLLAPWSSSTSYFLCRREILSALTWSQVNLPTQWSPWRCSVGCCSTIKQRTDCKTHLRLSEDISDVKLCIWTNHEFFFLKNTFTYSMLNKVYDTNFMQVSFIKGHEDTQDDYIYLLSEQWTEICIWLFFLHFILEWQVICFYTVSGQCLFLLKCSWEQQSSF